MYLFQIHFIKKQKLIDRNSIYIGNPFITYKYYCEKFTKSSNITKWKKGLVPPISFDLMRFVTFCDITLNEYGKTLYFKLTLTTYL